jgi:hypothetical protein
MEALSHGAAERIGWIEGLIEIPAIFDGLNRTSERIPRSLLRG